MEMSGAVHYLRSILGGKAEKNSKDLKKERSEESKIITIKKGKVVKKSGSTSSDYEKKEEVLRKLKGDFRGAYNASFELKTITKNGGTDLEKLQIKAIHSQLGVIAKMLDNLKK
jgi:hypothetical protein